MSTGKIIEKSKTKSDSWRTPPYFYNPLNDQGEWEGNKSPFHDSMLVIFDGRTKT